MKSANPRSHSSLSKCLGALGPNYIYQLGDRVYVYCESTDSDGGVFVAARALTWVEQQHDLECWFVLANHSIGWERIVQLDSVPIVRHEISDGEDGYRVYLSDFPMEKATKT